MARWCVLLAQEIKQMKLADTIVPIVIKVSHIPYRGRIECVDETDD